MRSVDAAQLRARTQESRRRPQLVSEVRVLLEGMGEIEETKATGPVHLNLEATDQHGDVAAWFDDFWWTELMQRWSDRMVTIQIAATPHAVLHPVITYHMDMLNRVMPRWRTIAFTYASDFADAESVNAIARSPFHEVRFIDGPRPESKNLGQRISGDVRLDALFGDIRREQYRIGASRPILTRLPLSVTAASTMATEAFLSDNSPSHTSSSAQPSA